MDARLAVMTAGERQDFDRAFVRANPIWAKGFREMGPVSPLGRAAFQQFAIEVVSLPQTAL